MIDNELGGIIEDAFDDPMGRPRYVGPATFFRLPLSESMSEQQADVAVVGVPVDLGVTNRPGARHGPRAVREASTLMRRYQGGTGFSPFDTLGFVDGGDVWSRSPYDLAATHRSIEDGARRIHSAGTKTLAVGGDHSISLPILRSLAQKETVALVQIDAHCDTGGDYLGSPIHHGSIFRVAVEEGLVDPTASVQVGIRGGTVQPDLWAFSREAKISIIDRDEIYDRGIDWVCAEIMTRVGERPTYVSFDIDSLDPAFAPGTGTPEIGGLTSYEALRLLRGLEGMHVAGADLVEVAPAFDPVGITQHAAAAILFQIACLLGRSPS